MSSTSSNTERGPHPRSAAAAGGVPAELAGACAAVRAAGPADSVAGVRPSYVAAPASVAEASAVLRAATALDLAVVVRGSGTRLDWGCPPGRCDLVLDTTAMDQVPEHSAGDLVARVQAGVRLDRLAGLLAAAGQRLALDPPAMPEARPRRGRADGSAGGSGGSARRADTGSAPRASTVGGVVATGAAGPLRLRYGTPRDLLIGITVVLADGTVARAGGRVVKNVAGYDLGKLFAGSYGTLGLIAEATFRLHPLPGAAAYVTAGCPDAAAAAAVMRAVTSSPLAPSAAEVDRPSRGGPLRAGILLEGTPEGVAERARRIRELLPPGSAVSAEPPPWWGRGAAAMADGTVARVAFWPGELAGVLTAIDDAGLAAGLDPAVSGSAAAGVLYVAAGPDAAAAVAAFVTALRAADFVRGTGSGAASAPGGAAGPPARGSVTVLHAPQPVRPALDLWGPVPSAGLMRAVKDQFDPGHRMSPGRFAGGI